MAPRDIQGQKNPADTTGHKTLVLMTESVCERISVTFSLMEKSFIEYFIIF